MQRLGPDHAGEGAQRRVVVAHGLIVVAARHGNAVFGAFQLRLQGQEVLVGLKLGVGFDRHQQPRQGAGKLALSLLILLEGGGVIEVGGVDVDAGGLGAGLDHLGQGGAFLNGCALNGGDQVRHQVGAALILALDIGPGGLGALLLGRNGVVAAGAHGGGQDDDSGHLPWVSGLRRALAPGRTRSAKGEQGHAFTVASRA